jgi:phage/plasmid-associated DNA primase
VTEPQDRAKHARNTVRVVTQDGVQVSKEIGGGRHGGGGPPADPPRDGRDEPDILDIGSDVEIARRLVGDLRTELGEIHWCEGRLWSYCDTHWIAYPEHRLRLAAHRYDGSHYVKPGRKNPETVQLGRNRINSIISELAAMLAAPGFFDEWPNGINCEAGFIRIGPDGAARLEAHERDHRCRQVLPGHWVPPQPGEDRLAPAPGSLLGRFLRGCFGGDRDERDKVYLLAETMGSAAAGIATRLRRPKAVILYGLTAENGKSQFLQLCRAQLPKGAAVAISPDKFGNEYYAADLAGALLNAPDELPATKTIASEDFKKVITGGEMTGRRIYGQVVHFCPRAQHVYPANLLPAFSRGIDKGVERRLAMLVYSRSIPPTEQIPDFGGLIAEEEPDLLLAFCVAGASRLRTNGEFTVPASSSVELTKWSNTADPVRGWVYAEVTVVTTDPERHRVTSAHAHQRFVDWAVAEGYRADTLPGRNGFVQRLRAQAPGIRTGGHTETGNYISGIRIGPKGNDDE